MSRVICEVCGTAYPEASTQCPICGSVRPADAQGVSRNDSDPDSRRPYQQVKGGRFSKANVRKRNMSSQGGSFSKSAKQAPPTQKAPSNQKKKKKKTNSNRGLVITVLVLLLAIIAVLAYIFIRFFMPSSKPEVEQTLPTSTEAPTEAIEDIPEEIYCQDIYLDSYEIYLDEVGDYTFIVVNPEPVDTTDELTFESEKSSIAMVDSDGRVTAVSKGETTITITCGVVSVQCKVIVGQPKEKLVFDTGEVLLENVGDTAIIYSGTIPMDEIAWRSDDDAVATIDAGVVTAVGSGMTVVYGEYDGIIVNCVVSCVFEEPTEPTEGGLEGNGGVTSDGEPEAEPTEAPQQTSKYAAPYMIKNLYGPDNESAMIKTGSSNGFKLALVDSNGTTIEGVTWSVEGSCCSVSDGFVTGLRSGNCKIVATFEGKEYKFTVYVY